jgi:hypothetical protein
MNNTEEPRTHPYYVLLIHGPVQQEIFVVKFMPQNVRGHSVPLNEAAKQLKEKGVYTHPSGDFTIRKEGVWPYIERYIFGLEHNGVYYVDIIEGFPTAVCGAPIPQGLKEVVDTKGYAESNDGKFVIWKEGTWKDDNFNASTAPNQQNQADGPCGPSCEELCGNQRGLSYRTGSDSKQHDENAP